MTDERKTPDEHPSDEFAHSDRTKAQDRPTPTAPIARSTSADDSPAAGSDASEAVDEASAAQDAAAEPPEDAVDADDAIQDVSEDAPATVAVAPPTEPGSPRPSRSPVLPILAVATGLLFLTTVLFGLMALAPRLSPIKTGATKLALQAMERQDLEELASRFAKNFVSIDHETIDRDLARMTADTTSAFAEKLERTIEAIGEQFKERKASSQGRALDAAVISQTDDSALVQVLLRRTKRNVGTKGPETGNQIVNVTLVKTDDGWKVDDLSQLGAEEE